LLEASRPADHHVSIDGFAHGTGHANVALVYVGLGEPDHAMLWLNKAYDARFNPSILLRPAFDPLRSSPQFEALRRRVGRPPGS
jgi:hypothetical protein